MDGRGGWWTAKARQAAVHTCEGVTLVTHWSHSTLLRVCVCRTSDSCSRVSVYVQSARVQRSLCLCCFLFSRTGILCVSLCQGATLRAPSLRDSDTHVPVRFTISPGAAQSDPELRELSPMRSGLAVRGGKSHWPVNESLPCSAP